MKVPQHLCANGEHKRIEVTCLDCIERLRAERDSYKEALHKIACAECSTHDAACERHMGTAYCACDARIAADALVIHECPTLKRNSAV